MKRLRQIGRSAALVFSVALADLTINATAWGQAGGSAAASKSYAAAYFLVFFCVALGLIAVLRPTNRKKPE